MTIEQAIKKAIEGGYDKRLDCGAWTSETGKVVKVWAIEKILLDPQFWQCLFGEEIVNGDGQTHDDWRRADDFGWKGEMPIWKFKQHQFIDHLAEGKSAEDYFKSLANKK